MLKTYIYFNDVCKILLHSNARQYVRRERNTAKYVTRTVKDCGRQKIIWVQSKATVKENS